MNTATKHQALPIKELADKCADSYSFDRYRSWPACVRMLRTHGLTDREIESVLRSKWTRWAGDNATAPYGKVTSADLERFIDKMEWWGKKVERLTDETFGTEA